MEIVSTPEFRDLLNENCGGSCTLRHQACIAFKRLQTFMNGEEEIEVESVAQALAFVGQFDWALDFLGQDAFDNIFGLLQCAGYHDIGKPGTLSFMLLKPVSTYLL
jgi:hypothetical protein